MAVQFWEGDILFDNGAVAMHPDCCCDDGTTIFKLSPCYPFSFCGTCHPNPAPWIVTVKIDVTYPPACVDLCMWETPPSNPLSIACPMTGDCHWSGSRPYDGRWEVCSTATGCPCERWQVGYAVEAHVSLRWDKAVDVRVIAWGHNFGQAELFWSGGLDAGNTWDCLTPTVLDHVYEPSCPGDAYLGTWFGATTDGTATIRPGDVENGDESCPGGDPIYSHSPQLGPHVGKVVKLSDGVWYRVTVEGISSDGEVEIIDTGSSCTEVCPLPT
jgi:hypothetical protein